MRLADGPKLPRAVFAVQFGKRHGAHTVKSAIAREAVPGNLLSPGVDGADKGVIYHTKVLVILPALVNAHQKQNALVLLAQ